MKNATLGTLLLALVILLLLVAPLLAVFVSQNVNDIVENGVNFWNVFWLALIAIILIPRSGGKD